mmetsp:Transcript_57141/g.167271  ORF Transcript_57141/g.167271 Transcript_57141/m.167271 type:complete len:97 (+) Transcript_57141:211-501(+)
MVITILKEIELIKLVDIRFDVAALSILIKGAVLIPLNASSTVTSSILSHVRPGSPIMIMLKAVGITLRSAAKFASEKLLNTVNLLNTGMSTNCKPW